MSVFEIASQLLFSVSLFCLVATGIYTAANFFAPYQVELRKRLNHLNGRRSLLSNQPHEEGPQSRLESLFHKIAIPFNSGNQKKTRSIGGSRHPSTKCRYRSGAFQSISDSAPTRDFADPGEPGSNQTDWEGLRNAGARLSRVANARDLAA